MSVAAQRALVVGVAVLAAAWLAVSYGNSHVIRQVQIVAADRHASNARLDAALRDARSGQALDPSRGTESLSYQASLEIRLRRIPEALGTLQEIVRREPDTAEPWFLIAQLSLGSDPALSARAEAQLRRLDPRGVQQRR
jgi:hypothetical protein